MDEVRMVRDAYPEPAPPTAREIARAKALLARPPRRTPPRLWWGLGGVVAAGTAATVSIALTGGATPGGGSTPAPVRTVRLDYRGAFLAAADNAERQPTGKYWYIDTFDGQSYIIRSKTGTYAITGATSETFSWHGVKRGLGEAYYRRDLPAHPVGRRDESLWRKAGSPTTFRVWSGDHYDSFTAKGTKWSVDGPSGIDPHGGGDFLGASAEDLQNLPTDSAELAKKFLNSSQMRKATGFRNGKSLPAPVAVASLKIHRVAALVGLSPTPPKVRAGLMRALAAQPGVHAIGHDTDPLGRRGVALASDDRPTTVTGEYGGPKAERGTYRWRTVVIFDESTGALLSVQSELTKPGGPYSEMKPGFIIDYQADRTSNWTDTKPKPPAALPSFDRP
ncbi:CU044_5270 family protein [Actinoallomurus rhizosphaericola]|uniref:CU044_5270 family protein n=1 Tax=Actinoallomurus rhizosphaericola TaxID=2952536 RepID=UPI0020909A54|nr:CU044_5270 family protein [Actinoallomurus rhizosphaericola]MCO5993099.1 CU044_5270 family protein [Actinoallomurus rhizosphaericola]